MTNTNRYEVTREDFTAILKIVRSHHRLRTYDRFLSFGRVIVAHDGTVFAYLASCHHLPVLQIQK